MELTSKIYVAGHKGLVGSAIWKNLQAKGYTNLVGRASSELDLRDQKAVEEFFAAEKPEYVFLAAAKVGGIMANSIYRADFIYQNLQIQNNVIHNAYLHGVKKLLFLGSTCIYPRDAQQPMKETELLTSPLEYTNEPYAIAKIAGIKMCESYNLQYGTNYIAVMPTNLYGPNDNFDLEKSHVLPAMIRKMHLGKCLFNNDWDALREDLNKRPVEGVSGDAAELDILRVLAKYGVYYANYANIDGLNQEAIREIRSNSSNSCTVELWGTGTPLREFLWSEEMADASVFCMENVNFDDLVREIRSNSSNSQEIRNTHINIGTGREITIRDLAYRIKEVVGFGGEIVFNSDKPDGTMRKLTDPSKLHSLGWHHKIEIEDGVKMMYDWYIS
ncbi:GDP-L-fucose synthase family protein [Acetobacteroides hydrogenigenes]|uniref:GDP-L-fucose synthase n=1 Tax=Acetobacteroides hydrogenigenes TaxID=979970 RepID=A0A4R2E3N6_9BACT|nr:GDP-L-fucose synthase [Acetobacteroides hydrogenigenes]TCN62221.1 GDP-L-fucose synthase [Acetobacteroides hydrogenigenes]